MEYNGIIPQNKDFLTIGLYWVMNHCKDPWDDPPRSIRSPTRQAPQHEANQKEDDHRQKPHPGTGCWGISPKHGWFLMENPNLEWMMNRGLRSPHFRELPYLYHRNDELL